MIEAMTELSSSNKKIKANGKSVILVTGGTGLVGKAIEDYVNSSPTNPDETWIFLGSKDGDIRRRDDTEVIFTKYKPTHVIHLAAKVGGLFANMNQKVEFYRENVLINDNIMECCRIYNVNTLVSFMSTCIFPDKTSYPIDETMLHNGPPHRKCKLFDHFRMVSFGSYVKLISFYEYGTPTAYNIASNEGYAIAKRLIDTLSRAYAEEYGCNFTSIIPTNIYGPHDNFSIANGHVIPGLIHKCYLAKKNKTPFTVWGSGKPLRQFIYSRDLAELTVWVMRNYKSPDPIILSVGEEDEVSIKDAALSIVKAMKFEGEVIFDTSKADGQFKKTASNSKLRKLLPDYKFTSIDEGIQKSVDWFVENYETLRK